MTLFNAILCDLNHSKCEVLTSLIGVVAALGWGGVEGVVDDGSQGEGVSFLPRLSKLIEAHDVLADFWMILMNAELVNICS